MIQPYWSQDWIREPSKNEGTNKCIREPKKWIGDQKIEQKWIGDQKMGPTMCSQACPGPGRVGTIGKTAFWAQKAVLPMVFLLFGHFMVPKSKVESKLELTRSEASGYLETRSSS